MGAEQNPEATSGVGAETTLRQRALLYGGVAAMVVGLALAEKGEAGTIIGEAGGLTAIGSILEMMVRDEMAIRRSRQSD